MQVSLFKRIITTYIIIGRTFKKWLFPILVGFFLIIIRLIIFFFMALDYIFIPSLWIKKIKNPIIIVGNPRSGTTFLQRFLVKNGFGVGTQLWQMIYSSILLQKILKPILPLLEYVSPAKHHSTDAHKTSLTSVETDDASMLFRFFDGFFLYGFLLSWSKNDLFHWVDPKKRDNTKRDFSWFKSLWKRVLIFNKGDRIVAKLFSLSTTSPQFIKKFPDAKILYMVRDPLNVIPSGLSLVTGVLDKMFDFWNLPEVDRKRFILRLYNALVELQLRFHDDWTSNKINKSNVMIVRYDEMMNNFDSLMDKIISFTGHEKSDDLLNEIKIAANKQKLFKSNHKYNLEKFGLNEKMIKNDCKAIYETFIN